LTFVINDDDIGCPLLNGCKPRSKQIFTSVRPPRAFPPLHEIDLLFRVRQKRDAYQPDLSTVGDDRLASRRWALLQLCNSVGPRFWDKEFLGQLGKASAISWKGKAKQDWNVDELTERDGSH